MATHLTLEEHDRIADLKSLGFALTTIAKALGCSPTVIARELRGNLDPWKSHLRRRGKRAQRRKKTVRPEHERIEGRSEVFEPRGRLGDLDDDMVPVPPATGGVITIVDHVSSPLTMTKITQPTKTMPRM